MHDFPSLSVEKAPLQKSIFRHNLHQNANTGERPIVL